MEDIKEASDKGCMGKLMSGDYRLVDVFWGGFFIVGGILTAFNNRIETLELGFLGTILLSIFYLFYYLIQFFFMYLDNIMCVPAVFLNSF